MTPDVDFVDSPPWAVLIADDSAPARASLRRCVEELCRRVEIIETTDGPSTLHVLSSRRVDIVFLDLAMPGMHGEDVVRTLSVRQRRMPFFVVVSGIGDPAQIARMRRLAAYDYLRKPVSRDMVSNVMAMFEHVYLPTRVLIIDDSDTHRSLIRRVFSASIFNLRIEEAGDGITAFEIYARRPADIVMLDVNMDGIGGGDTLRILRAHNRDVRVVLMSGDAASLSALGRAGAASVLKKPFTTRDVDALLHGMYGLALPYAAWDGLEASAS